MIRSIDNTEDILDSRDIIKRLEELESDLECCTECGCSITVAEDGTCTHDDIDPEGTPCANATYDQYARDEYITLRAFADDASEVSDWRYGETFIRDSYFTEYAETLAEDIGAISSDAGWPNSYIDWERAAEALKIDYSSYDFDGVTYWARCS